MLPLLLYAILTLVAGKEHEIVYPRMIVSRSGEKRVLFQAFDQDFHLRLEPTDVLADEFVLVTRDDKGNEAFLKPDVGYWRQRVLQDRNVGSTVVIDDDEGSLYIKGVINEELRIEPALDSEDAEGRRRSVNGVPHKVIKVSARQGNGGNFFDEIVPPGEKNTTNSTATDTRQSGQATVEIAVVVDKMLSEALGSDSKTMEYLIVLFNCVNLRFHTMKNILVICKLVGMKRNLQSSEQPYIENNMVNGYADAGKTLAAFADHSRTSKIFPYADVVHLVMKQEMGGNVAGIAYVAGVCDSYKYGVSQDNGCFSSCSTVAHELAHNLGCPHDGDPPPSYIKNSPGAESCPWADGNMMSYVEKYPNKYIFSKCSEQCVQYIRSVTNCMATQNAPSTASTTDTRLPGQALKDWRGLHERNAYYERRCKDFRSDLFLMSGTTAGEGCQYRCRSSANSQGTYYYWNMRCLDGETCGTDKICKNGDCTS